MITTGPLPSPSCDQAVKAPHVRQRKVCDRCGGRFGMVTHRWWGHKFCKRSCKEAYLRDIALGRDAIGRWFGFARLTRRSAHFAT